MVVVVEMMVRAARAEEEVMVTRAVTANARKAKVRVVKVRAVRVRAVRVRAVRVRVARAAKAGAVKKAMAVGARVEVARAAKVGVANEARVANVVMEEKVRVAVGIRRRLFCRLCDSCGKRRESRQAHQHLILHAIGRWEIFKVSVHVLSVVDRSIGSSCRIVQARVEAMASAYFPIGASPSGRWELFKVSVARTHCS